MKATFWGLDDAGEDVKVGTLELKDGKLVADPEGHRTLDEIADEVRHGGDLEAAMRELPERYRTAYFRAEVSGGGIHSPLNKPGFGSVGADGKVG